MMPASVSAGTCALVPVKRLGGAKSRLSAIMTAPERAALAEAMLLDVLDVLLAVKGFAAIVLVTGDLALGAKAGALGVRVIDDPHETGTNDAVARGLERLKTWNFGSALVVPGDIPFLGAVEIEAALAALARTSVVLAPARRDGGTNLLGLSPLDAIAPVFGPDSFARHLAAASAKGIKPVVLPSAGAGHDIDVPSDLTPDIGGGPALRTRALLKKTAAVERFLLT
jgi:2-phospho-L-lactate guanylyltransferase